MRFRSRLLDIACLASIAGVVAIFFWPVLLLGYWIPRGGGDLVSFLWPMMRFSAASFRAGVVPLWNPYQYSGAPFLADNQSGLFYPLNLLVAATTGEPSYEIMEVLVALHLWVAGANAFALSRGLGMRRLAALCAGVAFAFSDLFITHLGNLNLNATAAWLPMLILLTHRALTRRSIKWAAVAGMLVSVTALAGHAQMLLYSGVALGTYVLYRLAVDRHQGLAHAAQTVGLAAMIAAIGFGGAALTLLPAYEMAGHTGRGHLSYVEATRYSVPPQALIGLLAPGFYGRGPSGFWGPWDRVEVGYAGVATLILAFLGCCAWVRIRLRKSPAQTCVGEADGDSGSRAPLGFFAILIIGGFLLALGNHTLLYRILYEVVPTF
ncbi:MAG: hypothetical protein MUQ10_01110, partial [Anaerolineae bacterium]|nr:hypothetical protein [Anaerolineae bacterium]